MTSEWKNLLVSELADQGKRSTASGPFGSNLVSRDYTESGVPVIRGGNMSNGRWVGGDFAWVSEDKAEELSANLAFPGEIVFTQRGTLGQVCLVPDGPCNKYVLSQSQMKLRVNLSICDPLFMLYQFASPGQQAYIDMNAIRVGVPHTNLGILRDTPCQVPPLAEQKAIAHILGTLDDKIELNRKTNETLEAMAKALFKSWFVDFDPVRAKAEGRPTGLPVGISDLFPASFEDSELGDIPSEWKVEQLGEVIELAYGKPLKEEQRNGGSYPVFGSNGVVGSHDEYLVEAPGIVVGRKGNPGTVEWSEKNFYPIDTTFFVIKKKGGLGMRFLFYCLKNQNLSNLSADSAVPGLNRNHAYTNEQLLPPAEVAFAFERQLEVIFNRKSFLAEEINTLGATRDALLPKLISGEIRIPYAEKMLEEVGV